jgi:hypothetical protein
MVNAMNHFSPLSNLLLDIANLPAKLGWFRPVWLELVLAISLRHLVSGSQILGFLSPVSAWLMLLVQTIILGWPHSDRISSRAAEYNKSSSIQKNTLLPEFVGSIAALNLSFKVRRLLFVANYVHFLPDTDVGPLLSSCPQRQFCPVPVAHRRVVL